MRTHESANGVRWVAGWLPLQAVDPLAGADALGEPGVYWERPSAQEAVAGWGEAGQVEVGNAAAVSEVLEELTGQVRVRWLGEAPRNMPGPWFGGLRFTAHGAGQGEWAAFGLGRWVLPEVLVWREGYHVVVAAFAPEGPGAENAVQARLERVRAVFPKEARTVRSKPLPLQVSGSREDFEERVGRALERIASGQLHKVVLARAVEAVATQPFDRVDVLARLREHHPRCATFLFRAPNGLAFLGATPETLCHLEGAVLETEALAASAPPGQAGDLGSDKQRREHEAVVRFILESLQPLCERVHADAEPSLLPLRNVVHLRTGIHARLRTGVGVAEVVGALHPTPAVGGTPRERALGFLLEHEALDRGWYAGPVGWVGPGRARLMVALRSALVQGHRARLFVGAGTVAGSSAEAEWRETEMKALAMLRALGGEHG